MGQTTGNFHLELNTANWIRQKQKIDDALHTPVPLTGMACRALAFTNVQNRMQLTPCVTF